MNGPKDLYAVMIEQVGNKIKLLLKTPILRWDIT